MTFRKIALSIIIALGIGVNAYPRLPSEEQKSATETLFDLPPFERAICCIRFYEGMHSKKDYPYVGYGHKLRPGVTPTICQ